MKTVDLTNKQKKNFHAVCCTPSNVMGNICSHKKKNKTDLRKGRIEPYRKKLKWKEIMSLKKSFKNFKHSILEFVFALS